MRAVAVLAVILHHLHAAPGGFVGVDIFFVISGFVISQTLHDSDRTSLGASLLQFYYRRIIRIIPPLLIVTVACVVLGWLLFFDSDLTRLQQDVSHQALFLQNVYFVKTVADYFEGVSSIQLTLHTWSLAVEEQFYLLFPLFYLVLLRLTATASRLLTAAVIAFAALTAYVAVVDPAPIERLTLPLLRLALGDVDASAARFYVIPFRAWEFLLGCSAFTLKRQWGPRLASLVPVSGHVYGGLIFFTSLSLLCGAAFMDLAVGSWPNWQTIVLCLLAFCCLLASDSQRPLDPRPNVVSRVFAYLGNTSYSAYLWHWPVLGYLTYTNVDFGAAPTDYLVFALLLTACVVATYHTVEVHRFSITPALSVVVLVAFVAAMGYLGIVKRDVTRFSAAKQTILSTARYDVSPCEYDLRQMHRRFVVLFGDSHAQMVRSEFRRVANRHGFDVLCVDGSRAKLSIALESTSAELAPVVSSSEYAGSLLVMRWNMYALGFPDYEVEESGDRFLSWHGQRPQNKDQALQFFTSNLRELVQAMNRPGGRRSLGVLLQVPNMPFFAHKESLVDYHGLRFRTLRVKSTHDHIRETAPIRRVFSDLKASTPEIDILDPTPLLCDEDTCAYRDGWNVRYRDDDHLSVYGEQKLEPLFDRWMSSLEQDDGSATR